MGSVSEEAPKTELNVLVTGFGPFKKDFPLNPSWAIAEQLPAYLPPLRTKAPKGGDARKLLPVKIHVHPEPVPVTYAAVRDLVPRLWSALPDGPHGEPGPAIDFVIHVGMAGPGLQWQIERRAHRDGYALKDVDGEFLRDQDRRVREGDKWVWHGMPAELLSDLDVDKIHARWKQLSPSDADVAVSEDAGRFLCDFIYFSSMAHLQKVGERKRVVFLHVPASVDPKNLALGKELLLQLIRSIAESELDRQR